MAHLERCPYARAADGRPKAIFASEEEALTYAAEHGHETQIAVLCGRATLPHWHLTSGSGISGLKRGGKFGRRGGRLDHIRRTGRR